MRTYKVKGRAANAQMNGAIDRYLELQETNPNLTQQAYCIQRGFDNAFYQAFVKYMKNVESFKAGDGRKTSNNRGRELVPRDDINSFNREMTSKYTYDFLFEEVSMPGQHGGSKPTRLNTLAKAKFGNLNKTPQAWREWFCNRISKPCKDIYATMKTEESDDEYDSDFDV